MKKYVFTIATILILGFQNCSKNISVEDLSLQKPVLGDLETVVPGEDEGDVSSLPAPTPQAPSPGATTPTPTPTYSELKMNCEKALREGKIKGKVLAASFPNPNKTCDWERDGNMGYENERIRARREQGQTLDVNMGAKVCSLSMRSTLQNKFYYDDNLILTLNGFVLASTSNFTQHLENKEGYYIYDWNRLRTKYAQNLSHETELQDQYCAGDAADLSSCRFPVTETYGSVHLEFKDEVFQKIFSMTSANQINLGLVTTGDDNPETDCQHVDLEFSVDVLYYE